MQLPVNITYRGLKKSLGIEQLVLEKATRLDKFCDHISRCDVAIEQPNHTHKKGNQFRVRIDVTVPPGHELVAEEKQIDNGTHDPLAKVIHDAFKTMERELRRVVDKQRRNVKTHADSRSLNRFIEPLSRTVRFSQARLLSSRMSRLTRSLSGPE